MTRWIAAFALVIAFITSPVAAQEVPGRGLVEITVIPGGWTFFTEAEDSSGPSFGNYDLGAGVTFNINPFVGVEGEVNGALGIKQDLAFGGFTANTKSPHLLNYTGNVVLSVPNANGVVPYATGGVGGMSVFERTSLGIADTETFLTGNVGGGVKWYTGRWGLRADYRFIVVRSKDDAPEFFGQETRYGHRIYGGVVLNVGH